MILNETFNLSAFRSDAVKYTAAHLRLGAIKIKTINWLALILGSAWLVPVSCTSALIAGTHLSAYLDQRDVTQGDELHLSFAVAVVPGENGAAFHLVPLRELYQCRVVGVQYSTWMPTAAARLDRTATSYIAYRVLEQNEENQLIEVVESDDNRTLSSRYRTTGTAITPLGSRLFHVGNMMQALPYAGASALFLYGIGRWLRRRCGLK
jgi:hypothetical protein